MSDDFGVLFPEQEVALSTGESVTVREYGFKEGLQVDAFARPLIADLRELMLSGADDDALLDGLHELFGAHAGIVQRAVAVAVDRPLDWLEALSDNDGHALRLSWWGVNSGFFTRRLVRPRPETLMNLLPSLRGLSDTATAGAT